MIGIIDYDAGNIKSVEKALLFLGQEAVVTRDPRILLEADKVILPGVGAFGDAMGRLRQYGLEEVIGRIVEKGTPFLGICLGLQLLFESSEERAWEFFRERFCGFRMVPVLRFRIWAGIPCTLQRGPGSFRESPRILTCILYIPII